MNVPENAPTETLPDRLNRQCFCLTLDRDALFRSLEREIGDAEIYRLLTEAAPQLFSNVSVFLSGEELARMSAVVKAIDHVVRLAAYRNHVLSHAPEVARFDAGPIGALMGYDFHLGTDGPKLIEVNTNAGGAFLNAFLAPAHKACCPQPQRDSSMSRAHGFEAAAFRMFEAEWTRQRGSGMPSRIAIVDDVPSEQYLYPEMVLAKRLFQRHGVDAVIVDPKELNYKNGCLYQVDDKVDLVYNRLVDFSLERPEHQSIRQAYIESAVVLTPNPHVHALYADKRNLTLLSDPAKLRSWELGESVIEVLEAAIPRTVLVAPENADALWRDRKKLFFKPSAGYGSKGAYRGDKLTKTVWSEITKGGYVAQTFAPPGQRAVKVEGLPTALKADIRLYTYDGNILLTAARLYQGQTTNFRTPGGGFAPVFEVP